MFEDGIMLTRENRVLRLNGFTYDLDSDDQVDLFIRTLVDNYPNVNEITEECDRDGYERGYDDGRSEGWDNGYDEGRDDTEKKLQEKIEELENTIYNLEEELKGFKNA